MTTKNATQCVSLQGVGTRPGKLAGELVPGDVVMWDAGFTTTVEKVVPSKTGKTVTVTYQPSNHGRRYTALDRAERHERRHSVTRLVAVIDR